MELTPREKDKLLIFTAGLLAERRKARGLKLNYPESIAFISAALLEAARYSLTAPAVLQHLLAFATAAINGGQAEAALHMLRALPLEPLRHQNLDPLGLNSA